MTTFKPTWLYIKKHNQTGLKYFGKTTKENPISYTGSGVHWVRHIKRHSNDVTTIWCHLYTDLDSLVDDALAFSRTHNIVDSDEWANLIEEDGLAGGSVKGRTLTPEHKAKIAKAGESRVHTAETKTKIAKSKQGKTRPAFSDEWKDNMSKSRKASIRPKGYTTSKKGSHLTAEQKQHLSEVNSVPVYCITNDTWYKSTKIASAILGVSGISHCLNGFQKTTGGFIFSRKKCDCQSE